MGLNKGNTIFRSSSDHHKNDRVKQCFPSWPGNVKTKPIDGVDSDKLSRVVDSPYFLFSFLSSDDTDQFSSRDHAELIGIAAVLDSTI